MVTIDKMEPKLISMTAFDGINYRFSDTDFQKNDEGGRVFNFCTYMHIGPILRLHKSFTVVPSVIFTINHG
jgi:hypothetical protein